jgi:hypothetical protein
MVMYNVPRLWNAEDHTCPIAAADLETCIHEAEFRSLKPCDTDIFNLCCHILGRDQLEPALDANAGVRLFVHMKNAVMAML